MARHTHTHKGNQERKENNRTERRKGNKTLKERRRATLEETMMERFVKEFFL